jgi:elongation factor G
VKYKEAITGTVEHRELYKKQTGGRGKFADIHVRIEPQTDPAKTGLEFIDEIRGGSIPKEFIPPVRRASRPHWRTAFSPASRWKA